MLKPLLVSLALIGSLGLAGCGSGDDALTVYSGRTENLVGPILADFTEQTGTEVSVRYGDSAELALLIEEEGDRSPADVFISQSPGAMGYLAEQDRLASLSTETLALVDDDFKHGDGEWVAMSGRVRTLVYNTNEVSEEELPASIFDLTEPQYSGQVALAPTNGSFQDFVTAMRLKDGDETAQAWLDGMAANDAQVYADNTSIVQAVARGEVPMGLVNHYYNARQLAEDPSSTTQNYFFTDGDIGALLINTAIGVLNTAPNPEDAEELVRFMLDDEAQTFFSQETFEYPVAADVEPSGDLPPLDTIEVATVDVDELGGGLERTLEMINESGLNN